MEARTRVAELARARVAAASLGHVFLDALRPQPVPLADEAGSAVGGQLEHDRHVAHQPVVQRARERTRGGLPGVAARLEPPQTGDCLWPHLLAEQLRP